MAIAVANAAAFPVEDMVTGFKTTGIEPDTIPGDDLAPHSGVAGELPGRDNQAATGAQIAPQLPENTQAVGIVGDMVQQSQDEDCVKAAITED